MPICEFCNIEFTGYKGHPNRFCSRKCCFRQANMRKSEKAEQELISNILNKIPQDLPEDACWEWLGSRDVDGYGRIKHKKKYNKAHRLSYQLFIGEIPEGLLICHHCDNPPCVNPKHLYAGTEAQNNKDAMIRGRNKSPVLYKSGEDNPRAKVTNEQRQQIKDLYATNQYSQRSIAKIFNITQQAVCIILKSNK